MLEISKITELAKEYGTPMYLFDLDELNTRICTMRQILGDDVEIAYAMKANPFLVDAMKTQVSKFEVCSPGEFAICERLIWLLSCFQALIKKKQILSMLWETAAVLEYTQ